MFNVTMAEEMARAMAAKGFTEAEIVKVITAVAEGAPATASTATVAAATAAVPTPAEDRWVRKGLAFGIRVAAPSNWERDRQGTMWFREDTQGDDLRQGVVFADDFAKGKGRGTRPGEVYVATAAIDGGKVFEVGPVQARQGRRVVMTIARTMIRKDGTPGVEDVPVYVADTPAGITTAFALNEGRQVSLTLGRMPEGDAVTSEDKATAATIKAKVAARTRKG